MDIAYTQAQIDYSEVDVVDENGNLFEEFEISNVVQEPSVFESDEENHTVTIMVPIMMWIDGESNSGTFHCYEIDLITGECSEVIDEKFFIHVRNVLLGKINRYMSEIEKCRELPCSL